MIEVICGPMFAGKSEELIRRLTRAQIGGKHVMAVKPKLDTRYSEDHIVTHAGSKVPAVALEDIGLLERIAIRGDYDVVGIDEAQFYPSEIVDQVRVLSGADTLVIVSGLDMTCNRTPFGSMGDLLAMADRVQKLTAVCKGCGGEATLTQRIHPDGSPSPFSGDDEVEVGGAESYQARCRSCFDGKFLLIP